MSEDEEEEEEEAEAAATVTAPRWLRIFTDIYDYD